MIHKLILVTLVLSLMMSSCKKSATSNTTDPCIGTAGPKFTAVKSVIQSQCLSCHNASMADGGVNLSTDCSIISAKNRIKVRAVDGTPTPMPTTGLLPASERQKITDWINAGGRVTD